MQDIRVTTQDLRARQGEWLETADRARSAFLAAADTGINLEECFSGQQAYSLKTDFLTVKSEGEKAFGILRRHLEKLSAIAGVYDEAERSNTGVITDN